MEKQNQQKQIEENGIESISPLSNGFSRLNSGVETCSFSQNNDMTTTSKMDQVLSVLRSTAMHISKTALSNTSTTSSSGSSLVRDSNSSQIHEELETILSQNFYPHNLNSLHSVIVFLLLNYFMFRKDSKQEESEFEKGVFVEECRSLSEGESLTLEGEFKQLPPSRTILPSSHCDSCGDLRESLDVVSSQFDRLKISYEELCHINEQWALDYETLTKQISNTTGFHSVATSNSSHSTSSSCTSHAHTAHVTQSCLRCPIYEAEVKDKNQEIEDLKAIIVGLREDIKECREGVNQKQREMTTLESDYQVIRMQIQELGDLQQALNMKNEYRTMQRSLQHKTKQYQEAMCEKMELQKQIEKLRQAFLKCFTNSSSGSSSQSQTMVSSSSSSHHSGGMSGGGASGEFVNGGYYSFPLHSCRQNIQSYPVNPNPPTPPGLLARGDFRGTQVEKDENSVPKIQIQQGQLSDSTASYFLSWPKQSPRGQVPVPPPSSSSSSRPPIYHSSLDNSSTVTVATRGNKIAAHDQKVSSSSSANEPQLNHHHRNPHHLHSLHQETNGVKSLSQMDLISSTSNSQPFNHHHSQKPSTGSATSINNGGSGGGGDSNSNPSGVFKFPAYVHNNINSHHYPHPHPQPQQQQQHHHPSRRTYHHTVGSTNAANSVSLSTTPSSYYNSISTSSSLGYGSSETNGTSSDLRLTTLAPYYAPGHSPNHTPSPSPRIPRSKSSLDTYSCLDSEFSSGKMTAPRSLSHESIAGRPFTGPNQRPKKLVLGGANKLALGGGGGGESGGSLALTQQQSLSCPNCKKVFVSRYQNEFDQWFEHMKECAATTKSS